jgi:hypothetical protein
MIMTVIIPFEARRQRLVAYSPAAVGIADGAKGS